MYWGAHYVCLHLFFHFVHMFVFSLLVVLYIESGVLRVKPCTLRLCGLFWDFLFIFEL